MAKIAREWAVLYKALDGGKVGVWRIWVEMPSVIVVEYGQQGGKLQLKKELIKEGKNVGKKNETTPLQQAISEAESRWARQIDRKQYGTVLAESSAKRGASPMLAEKFKDHADSVNWARAFGQPKLNGNRCLAGAGDSGSALRSREGLPIKTLAHIEDALKAFLAQHDNITLDGEIYLHGVPHSQINGAIKAKKDLSARLEYHVYDAIIPDMPFEDRYAFLQEAFPRFVPADRIQLVTTVKVRSQAELNAFQAEVLGQNYEGVMVRDGGSPYVTGKRTKALLKYKNFQEDDFIIVDCKEGRGTAQGCAVFVCRTGKGHHFDVLAPGSLQEKKDHYKNRASLIGQFVTVRFLEYTATESPVPCQLAALRVRPGRGRD